jgi:hypothetical protein
MFDIALFLERDHKDPHTDDAFRSMVTGVLQHLTKEIIAMRAEIQTLVDNVAQLKTNKASSDLAWTTMVAQTTDLKTQVAALQAQAAAGGIDSDSLAAVVKAAGDVHDVATGMQQAVPANVPPAPNPAAG